MIARAGLTDYASEMSIYETMKYCIILFTVFIISFLIILSMSSAHAKALQPTQSQSPTPPSSLLKVTSQKQFDEWQNESDHAEQLDDYVAETNTTDKIAIADCVNELVLSRNGTLEFAAVYSNLINTNSNAHPPSSGLDVCDNLFSGWRE